MYKMCITLTLLAGLLVAGGSVVRSQDDAGSLSDEVAGQLFGGMTDALCPPLEICNGFNMCTEASEEMCPLQAKYEQIDEGYECVSADVDNTCTTSNPGPCLKVFSCYYDSILGCIPYGTGTPVYTVDRTCTLT